jgi:hypothetical protein
MANSRIIPRGIRNNNPLNIRIGNVWLGEVRDPSDPNFEQFISMVYGVRAGFVLLRRYIRHYHRTTIPQVIAAWAPSNENNTTAYIDKVCQVSGIERDVQLKFEDEDQMVALVDAMILVECGQHIQEKVIRDGYRFA